MSNVINSLKRLERLGSETSGATLKLVKAAKEVAGLIAPCFTPNDFRWNPQFGEYDVIVIRSEQWQGDFGFYVYLDKETRETTLFTLGDSPLNPSGDELPSRAAALHLSEAIAGGFLEDVVEHLSIMREEDDLATSHLEGAKQKATNLAMGLPIEPYVPPSTPALRTEGQTMVIDLGKL